MEIRVEAPPKSYKYSYHVTEQYHIYPKNSITYDRNTCTFMFTAALVTIARKWSQVDVPQLINR